MPSQLHEAMLLLFRNNPTLAPELLRDPLGVELPAYTEARIESADLSDLHPATYHADLVVLLYDGKPVQGIIVEVQLARKVDKLFSWPAYATGLRARIRCPVCLFVVTADDGIARWAARPIEIGGGNHYKPFVLGPAGVPVVTEIKAAKADPELAVLSAMAHGRDRDPGTALQVAVAALAASVGLDDTRSTLYSDLIVASLSAAARKALRTMDPAKYEFQTKFAKRYIALGETKGEAKGIAAGRAEGEAKGIAKGRAEGETKGRAETLIRLLILRFGSVSATVETKVRSATISALDAYTERVLTAASVEEVLAPIRRKAHAGGRARQQ